MRRSLINEHASPQAKAGIGQVIDFVNTTATIDIKETYISSLAVVLLSPESTALVAYITENVHSDMYMRNGMIPNCCHTDKALCI